MTKKVYVYINPNSLEDAIQFMNKNNNNKYQQDFFHIQIIKIFILKKN